MEISTTGGFTDAKHAASDLFLKNIISTDLHERIQVAMDAAANLDLHHDADPSAITAEEFASLFFDAIDLDGGGTIEQDEVEKLGSALGESEAQTRSKWIHLLAGDSDKDGHISKSEFVQQWVQDTQSKIGADGCYTTIFTASLQTSLEQLRTGIELLQNPPREVEEAEPEPEPEPEPAVEPELKPELEPNPEPEVEAGADADAGADAEAGPIAVQNFGDFACTRLHEMIEARCSQHGAYSAKEIFQLLRRCADAHIRADARYEEAADELLNALGCVVAESRSQSHLQKCRANLTAWLDDLSAYYFAASDWGQIDSILAVNCQAVDCQNEAQPCEPGKKPAHTTSAAATKNWGTLRRSVWEAHIMQTLRMVREFRTMTDILRSVQQNTEDPLSRARAELNAHMPPFIVFLGGGMAAGKSSVVAKLHTEGCVVIEADNFKHNDVVYQQLNDKLGGDNRVAAMVHGYSTEAANQQLIAALASGRNIVLDGTCSWLPYVQQTIEMVRNFHQFHYRLGSGYDHKTGAEEYFVRTIPVNPSQSRKPYRIKMVGVSCEPALAVARALRRKMICGRGVPLRSQLRSHKVRKANTWNVYKGVSLDRCCCMVIELSSALCARSCTRFASLAESSSFSRRSVVITWHHVHLCYLPQMFCEAFEKYLELVDEAVLYDTSREVVSIAHFSRDQGGKLLRDPELYAHFLQMKAMNVDATMASALYAESGRGGALTEPNLPILDPQSKSRN
eukprot:SAG11_NODE_1079_length_5962_cov_20.499232_1_plen_737_part_00